VMAECGRKVGATEVHQHAREVSAGGKTSEIIIRYRFDAIYELCRPQSSPASNRSPELYPPGPTIARVLFQTAEASESTIRTSARLHLRC
jgi:hypothetical protein